MTDPHQFFDITKSYCSDTSLQSHELEPVIKSYYQILNLNLLSSTGLTLLLPTKHMPLNPTPLNTPIKINPFLLYLEVITISPTSPSPSPKLMAMFLQQSVTYPPIHPSLFTFHIVSYAHFHKHAIICFTIESFITFWKGGSILVPIPMISNNSNALFLNIFTPKIGGMKQSVFIMMAPFGQMDLYISVSFSNGQKAIDIAIKNTSFKQYFLDKTWRYAFSDGVSPYS